MTTLVRNTQQWFKDKIVAVPPISWFWPFRGRWLGWSLDSISISVAISCISNLLMSCTIPRHHDTTYSTLIPSSHCEHSWDTEYESEFVSTLHGCTESKPASYYTDTYAVYANMEFHFVHGICEITLADCWGKPEQTHANMIDRNSIWLTHPYFTCGFEQSFSLGMK